jgi:hypothetical protein
MTAKLLLFSTFGLLGWMVWAIIIVPLLPHGELAAQLGPRTNYVYNSPGNTVVLVRTNHAEERHGDNIHNCFNDPDSVDFFQEASTGRIHVLCSRADTLFDLIVKDRRNLSGYVEEITAYPVDGASTFYEFEKWITSRVMFPGMRIPPPDWYLGPILFLFGIE